MLSLMMKDYLLNCSHEILVSYLKFNFGMGCVKIWTKESVPVF
jgi:hypothetical protein